MKADGNTRHPEFTEEDYISAIETAIKGCVHPPHFVEISRVSQDAEHELGYDGVLTSMVPFYLQFKRSTFHTPAFAGQRAKDRERLGFDCSAGFFSFPLHQDRKSGEYEQHNALWRLAMDSSAAYAAPMFYKKEGLTRLKQTASGYPWHYEDVEVYEDGMGKPVLFQNTRLLIESICIPPHREVTDKAASHHYTYGCSAGVGFHSEPEIPGSTGASLSAMLHGLIRHALSTDATVDTGLRQFKRLPEYLGLSWESRRFNSLLRHYIREFGAAQRIKNAEPWMLVEQISPVTRLLLLEAILQRELGIVQFTVRVRRPGLTSAST